MNEIHCALKKAVMHAFLKEEQHVYTEQRGVEERTEEEKNTSRKHRG